MRECETFIPSLDIVAVDTDADDKIVGSSMCVKSHIKGDDGCKYDIVTLGPIACCRNIRTEASEHCCLTAQK